MSYLFQDWVKDFLDDDLVWGIFSWKYTHVGVFVDFFRHDENEMFKVFNVEFHPFRDLNIVENYEISKNISIF